MKPGVPLNPSICACSSFLANRSSFSFEWVLISFLGSVPIEARLHGRRPNLRLIEWQRSFHQRIMHGNVLALIFAGDGDQGSGRGRIAENWPIAQNHPNLLVFCKKLLEGPVRGSAVWALIIHIFHDGDIVVRRLDHRCDVVFCEVSPLLFDWPSPRAPSPRPEIAGPLR